jgi:hypothetical protein
MPWASPCPERNPMSQRLIGRRSARGTIRREPPTRFPPARRCARSEHCICPAFSAVLQAPPAAATTFRGAGGSLRPTQAPSPAQSSWVALTERNVRPAILTLRRQHLVRGIGDESQRNRSLTLRVEQVAIFPARLGAPRYHDSATLKTGEPLSKDWGAVWCWIYFETSSIS